MVLALSLLAVFVLFVISIFISRYINKHLAAETRQKIENSTLLSKINSLEVQLSAATTANSELKGQAGDVYKALLNIRTELANKPRKMQKKHIIAELDNFIFLAEKMK